jgi:murein L,D-transpeptidase YcbB/YkuD
MRPAARPLLLLLLLLLGLAWARLAVAAPPEPEQRELIRGALEAPSRRVLGEPLRERAALERFYAARDHQPAWPDPAARGSAARGLLEALGEAPAHGLDPDDYHRKALATRLPEMRRGARADRRAALDLLLTDAFLHLAQHLARGVVDPRSLHPRYERGEQAPDPVTALQQALGSAEPAAALAGLAPPQADYARLSRSLSALRSAAAAGGWPGVPAGPAVKPGERHPRVAALRARLAWPREPAPPARGDAQLLDPRLAEQLRRFQALHGLESDGILGPDTTRALGVTAAERLDQVRANLERWRWQPRDLGARHVRVNAAGFDLMALVDGEPALSMRVVVGCRGWKTPLLHSAVTHLVLNPAWDVPRSIAVREMLPRARRNPGYFASKGIDVLRDDGDGAGPRPVDPAAVDWRGVEAESFPYRLRQPPGPRNPLGRIKFVFPNRFGVYLHGTPGRAALARSERALSHGCVRLEDELALALFALQPDAGWTQLRLLDELEVARERRVPLSRPLPVHLLYLTASADARGSVRFTRDPYGWDARLLAALDAASP